MITCSGYPATISNIARLLGDAAALLGEPEEALACYDQALAICGRVGFRPETAITRMQLAELLIGVSPGDRVQAYEHLDFAISEFEVMKMVPYLERALQLRGRRRPPPQPKAPEYPDALSEREVEVLRLIAAGRSNQQIAEDLMISPHTVVRHVSNIFAKAGVSNRVEAATYAQRHGLIQESSAQ
jgi:DNA-binding CsgD family transcriptional regulator